MRTFLMGTVVFIVIKKDSTKPDGVVAQIVGLRGNRKTLGEHLAFRNAQTNQDR